MIIYLFIFCNRTEKFQHTGNDVDSEGS